MASNPPTSPSNTESTSPQPSQEQAKRSKWFRVLAVLLGFTLAFGLGEVAARIYLSQSGQTLDVLRQHLSNEVPQQMRIQGQAYLLYTPAPGYQSGRNHHSAQGYRGEAVPLQRAEGVLRVLCLGGSTTYGTGVEDAREAYPAQLEQILNQTKPDHVARVEVINGGLEYATTAELLTHYHFKYHYYRPDLVIINTGGNDALPPSFSNYHPDYSHWRQQPTLPRPLSPIGRSLMKSRLLSLAIIALLYSGNEGDFRLDRMDGIPPTVWYESPDSDTAENLNPAFEHNLMALLEEIQRDGAASLLVPYRLAPDYDVPEEPFIRENERTLQTLAQDRELGFAPFPASVISPENWMDGSHLNAAGCREKAKHIASFAGPILWEKKDPLKREDPDSKAKF